MVIQLGTEVPMGRGAPGCIVAAWIRTLSFLAVVAVVMVAPAAALATGGTSDWTPAGGTSEWTASPTAEPLTDTPASVSEMVAPAPDLTAPKTPVAEPAILVAVDGIAFPIAGRADYSASFGAPRPEGRTHKGVDIFADKMTPVVAAADGTVSFVRNGIGTDCCVVKIRHDDGRSSLYLHLNNDTLGTDDGLGYGLADGIALGVRVQAGTVIGYVGDSGNAEETPPHLHFEIHDAFGQAVDPYPYLQIAQGAEPALFASALAAQPEALPETGSSLAFLVSLSAAFLGSGTLLTGLSRRRS
jgi:murein DD-endopeptidase MepM/ murein hydrolase activator NlpD